MHLHIQDIPDTASILDVKNFFPDFEIPYGSIWILGGVNGDAFVTFRSHEDLSKALMHDGMLLHGHPLKLSLSDRNDIENLLDQRFADLLLICSSDIVSVITSDTANLGPLLASSHSAFYREDTRERTVSASLSRPPWQDEPYSSNMLGSSNQEQFQSEKKTAQDVNCGISVPPLNEELYSSKKLSSSNQDQLWSEKIPAQELDYGISVPPSNEELYSLSSNNQDQFHSEKISTQDIDYGISVPTWRKKPYPSNTSSSSKQDQLQSVKRPVQDTDYDNSFPKTKRRK